MAVDSGGGGGGGSGARAYAAQEGPGGWVKETNTAFRVSIRFQFFKQRMV